jgi:hypothetical protein
MKTNIWILGIALVCILAFTACNEKKAGTNTEVAEEADSLVQTQENNEVDSLVAETSEEQIDEEDSNDWENEVWTTLGGTYCFFGDGRQYAVEFPLEENKTSATLYFGEEELEASLNPQTGLLVACDDEGNEVFRGAIYAGGNLLKGTYRGRHLEVWGSGD